LRKWHGGDFVIKMKGQDDVTIILILGVSFIVRIQASSRAIQALMEENRLMYSHWATPFQYPAQLLIQGPDTLHGQIVSNTFIILYTRIKICFLTMVY
jgi:hypothetical protein